MRNVIVFLVQNVLNCRMSAECVTGVGTNDTSKGSANTVQGSC
jgi:hypothetical protein